MNESSNENDEAVAATTQSTVQEQSSELTNGEVPTLQENENLESQVVSSSGTVTQSEHSNDTDSITSGDESQDYQDENEKSVSPLTALNFPPPPPPEEEEERQEVEEEKATKPDSNEALISELANAAEFIIAEAINEVVLIESLVATAINDAILAFNYKDSISRVVADHKEKEELKNDSEINEQRALSETTINEEQPKNDNVATSEHPKSDVTAEMPNPSLDEVVKSDDVTVEVANEKLNNDHPDDVTVEVTNKKLNNDHPDDVTVEVANEKLNNNQPDIVINEGDAAKDSVENHVETLNQGGKNEESTEPKNIQSHVVENGKPIENTVEETSATPPSKSVANEKITENNDVTTEPRKSCEISDNKSTSMEHKQEEQPKSTARNESENQGESPDNKPTQEKVQSTPKQTQNAVTNQATPKSQTSAEKTDQNSKNGCCVLI